MIRQTRPSALMHPGLGFRPSRKAIKSWVIVHEADTGAATANADHGAMGGKTHSDQTTDMVTTTGPTTGEWAMAPHRAGGDG